MNEVELAEKRRKNIERRIRLLESHGLSDPRWAPGLASVSDIVKGCFLLASDLVEEMQADGILKDTGKLPEEDRSKAEFLLDDMRIQFTGMLFSKVYISSPQQSSQIVRAAGTINENPRIFRKKG